jgi:hypothetical protein
MSAKVQEPTVADLTKRVTIRATPEMVKAMRREAIERDTTLQGLGLELILDGIGRKDLMPFELRSQPSPT